MSSDRVDGGSDEILFSFSSLSTLSLQQQRTHTASPAQSPRSPDIPDSLVLVALGSSLPCRFSGLVSDRGCGGSHRARRRPRCGLTGKRMGPRSSTARVGKERPERQCRRERRRARGPLVCSSSPDLSLAPSGKAACFLVLQRHSKET